MMLRLITQQTYVVDWYGVGTGGGNGGRWALGAGKLIG